MQTQLKTLDSILIALLKSTLIVLQAVRTDILKLKSWQLLSICENVSFLSKHYHIGNDVTLSAYPPAEGVLLVRDDDTVGVMI